MAARPRWREDASALVYFVLATLVFLWPALARFHEASYTSADLSQTYALTTIDGPVRPGNEHLSDPVVEMLPWLEFNKSELREGRLPTWNPWNGAGVPHLANYQSAVFSPFSLPFYFAPLKWALVLSAFLKLGALGYFTFLFLRALGIGFAAACAGGTIFQFGGHNVLLLAYPHSAVAVGFPAALWIIERAWQAALADPAAVSRKVVPWACGLAVAFAGMLLAGNPETAAFAIAVSGIYALARAVGFARAHPEGRAAARCVLGWFGVASLLGLSIAAIQILPFFEYAARSTLIEKRSIGFDGLPAANWPLQFFPDLFGKPTQRYYPRPDLPAPNYEAANTSYFGPLALLLALFGACFHLRRRPARFFALLALLWPLCAFDFAWIRPLMVAFTALTHAPVNRSQFVPLMALAVLAAIALDELRPRDASMRWGLCIVVCTLAAGLLWTAHRGAELLVVESFQGAIPQGQAVRVPPHLRFMTWTFAAGALAFSGLALARAKWIRLTLVTAIIVLLFAQSGWLLRDFNSLSRDEHVFPRTAALDTIVATIGKQRLQVIGEDTLPPHTNMAYGIASIAVYDALCIAYYDRLYRTFFQTEGNWRETLFTTDHALKTLGVRYLLVRDDWPRLNPGITPDPLGRNVWPAPLLLRPGMDVTQTFRVEADGLERVTLALGAQDDPIPAFAELSLEDAQTGVVISTRRLDTHSLRAGLTHKSLSLFAHDLHFSSPTGWVQLEFTPQAHSAGRSYRLRLSAEAGAWKHGFIAWRVADEAPGERELRLGDAKMDARLCLDWAANFSRDLELLARFDPFTLYRYGPGLGRFWMARETRLAPDSERAFQMTVTRDHDPDQVAILEGVEERELRERADAPLDGRCIVIQESSRRIELAVNASRAAWLVAAIAWYPGWKARVDGIPVAIAKANYAFLGVAVPSGEHRIELEFDSGTVRAGAWISAVALILLAGLALFGRRAR